MLRYVQRTILVLLKHNYRCSSALLESLDLPWVVWSAVLSQYLVVDFGVDVFRIYESTIYIEYASTYTWEIVRHCAVVVESWGRVVARCGYRRGSGATAGWWAAPQPRHGSRLPLRVPIAFIFHIHEGGSLHSTWVARSIHHLYPYKPPYDCAHH
jgi:hypothetical protein